MTDYAYYSVCKPSSREFVILCLLCLLNGLDCRVSDQNLR